MIYNLRKKFIKISALSILIVFSVIFAGIAVTNRIQLNNTMDTLVDVIAENGGHFPDFNRQSPQRPPRHDQNLITEETKFSIRFFTVWLNGNNTIIKLNTDSIFSVDKDQITEYTEKAINTQKERGWVEGYRYKVFNHSDGKAVVFVNGEMNSAVSNRFVIVSFMVLTCSGFMLLLIFIILSKRVVKPIAESYEKQKQFITDANHELKTPLTLIMSNVDIVEEELGKSEWLDDIRSEGQRMTKLINRLVALSRMDEEQNALQKENFDLTNVVYDVASEFVQLACENNKILYCLAQPNVVCKGDEAHIRQLMSILLDNAVKYCDTDGEIHIALTEKSHPVITVENTYTDVDNIELDKLFDRFYRADKARTYDGSFGIGLSLAKEIANKHGGEISAYKKDKIIGFKVDLK